jgi:hypothetical protein
MEAGLEDPSILQCEPNTIEEARLVLKYVMVMGNKMAYAKHISLKTDRMCSKIENGMECGLHLDNRIGHNQFQHAVDQTAKLGQFLKKKIELKGFRTYYVMLYHTYLWMEMMK